ncbi:MAG: hypothetical protein KDD45_16075, partial [Bdellovibrionales bacterium]|nr:hypothetical protein [Bdellovibrionales bacterium]
DRPNQNGPSIKISLFTQELSSGIDGNGLPVRKPVLKAYIQRSDNTSTGAIYSVSYNDISNSDNFNMVIFNPSDPSLDISALRGNFSGSQFTAQVLSRNGIIGTIDLKWIDGNPQVPSNNIVEQGNLNLLKLYKNIEGSYVGTVNAKGLAPFPIKISLNAAMAVGNKPIIRGFYQVVNEPSGVLDLDLDVEYKVDSFPQRITMTSLLQNNRSYFLNLDGTISCKPVNVKKVSDKCVYQIEGTILLPKNRKADLTLTKQ